MVQSHILKTTFFVAAVAFVAMLPLHPYPGSFILKAIPAIALALLVFQSNKTAAGTLIATGLLFSAGGDIALDFHKSMALEPLFIVGLGLFLTAHILYIVAFAKNLGTRSPRKFMALLVIALAVAMTAALWPKLADMQAPVAVYILAICMMGVLAAIHESGGWILFSGAFIFMLSDSAIAINKFLLNAPHPLAPYFIMVTYYSAQYLIAESFVRQFRSKNINQVTV